MQLFLKTCAFCAKVKFGLAAVLAPLFFLNLSCIQLGSILHLLSVQGVTYFGLRDLLSLTARLQVVPLSEVECPSCSRGTDFSFTSQSLFPVIAENVPKTITKSLECILISSGLVDSDGYQAGISSFWKDHLIKSTMASFVRPLIHKA